MKRQKYLWKTSLWDLATLLHTALVILPELLCGAPLSGYATVYVLIPLWWIFGLLPVYAATNNDVVNRYDLLSSRLMTTLESLVMGTYSDLDQGWETQRASKIQTQTHLGLCSVILGWLQIRFICLDDKWITCKTFMSFRRRKGKGLKGSANLGIYRRKNTDLRCLESVFYFSPVLSCSLTPVRALSLVLQRLTPPYPSSTHAGWLLLL